MAKVTLEFSGKYVRTVAVDELPEIIALVGKRLAKLSEDNQRSTPPKPAESVLLWILPKDQRNALIGDLEEEYRTLIVPKLGERAAQWWYWKQAIFSVAPTIGGWLRKISIYSGAAWLFDWILGRLG